MPFLNTWKTDIVSQRFMIHNQGEVESVGKSDSPFAKDHDVPSVPFGWAVKTQARLARASSSYGPCRCRPRVGAPPCTFPISVQPRWTSARETTLQEDTVSDGTWGAVQDTSKAMISGHWERQSGREKWETREDPTLRRKFWCQERWLWNQQWRNPWTTNHVGAFVLAPGVAWGKRPPSSPWGSASSWVELVHL